MASQVILSYQFLPGSTKKAIKKHLGGLELNQRGGKHRDQKTQLLDPSQMVRGPTIETAHGEPLSGAHFADVPDNASSFAED
jgi:hypothetical protein